MIIVFCVLLKKHVPVSKRHTVLEQKAHFLVIRPVILSLYHGEILYTGVLCSLSSNPQMNIACSFFRNPWNTAVSGGTFQSVVSRRLEVVPSAAGHSCHGRFPVHVSGLWELAAIFACQRRAPIGRCSEMTVWLSLHSSPVPHSLYHFIKHMVKHSVHVNV